MSDTNQYEEEEFVTLEEDLSDSPLYSEDLAPTPKEKRTWNLWNLSAIWVGMAVCIPTYMLAAGMVKEGLSWQSALIIIGLANIIITIPMVLNGHAGVKYGIPFPVLGRSSFGINGIHIASLVRAIVACGWFGIQTWIGGQAFYAIGSVLFGYEPVSSSVLSFGRFAGFGLFWLVNVYFIWKGTESIKKLETWSAPILVLMGVLLVVWGGSVAGDYGLVLDQSPQLAKQTAVFTVGESSDRMAVLFNPLKDKEGKVKPEEYQLYLVFDDGDKMDTTAYGWKPLNSALTSEGLADEVRFMMGDKLIDNLTLYAAFRANTDKGMKTSSWSAVKEATREDNSTSTYFWKFIFALTAMVGFWATMSLSIADITRYAKNQSDQVKGQFIGLPGTMILYSFVGIFVTCSAVINFDGLLIAEDAPWDPVNLLTEFDNPIVIVIAQIFMIIATLSTNIAANVIAPANAFSNLFPKQVSFRNGGIATAIIGIIICPWWLMNDLLGILVFVSGLLGPVLGILLADYFVIRKKKLNLPELYRVNGEYAYGGSGFNQAAVIALSVGVVLAVVGKLIPAVDFLYSFSWFTGFGVSFFLYWILMKDKVQK